ncbi:hypothetical protein ACFSTE_04205 [Aquimarina hainanensis]|uniref:Peptidase S74 domain-containing protein n=1 Tax=Aquimarina hainanensis TaxID=1578017 RepID=A0ABW5N795_9FLAO
MKKLLFIIISIAIHYTVLAQWDSNTPTKVFTNDSVSIGTATPYSKFHVLVDDENTISWPAVINNTRNSATISGYGVGLQLKHAWNHEDYKWGGIASIQEGPWANLSGLALFANETEYMRIRSNGDIGIGTNTPETKLHLDGLGTANGIQFENKFKIRTSSNTNNHFVFEHIATDGNLYIRSVSTNANDTGNLIINDIGGNIGFGTSSPSNGLVHIFKNATIGNISSPNLVNAGLRVQDNGSSLYLDGNTLYTNGHMIVGTIANKWFSIGTNNVERFRITETGNVGIGTTNTKGFKLGVKGKIAAEEVKVALYNTWPDFVFEKDYILPSLQEVENYIKEKGHLQDIPSAKEVAKNGFFLGNMDAKLLQKIEELTLYTIAQQNKIKKQQSRIEKLEMQNEQLQLLTQQMAVLQSRLEKLEK